MNVALLLITHKNIGKDMMMITSSILDDEFDNAACIEIPMDADIDAKKRQIADTLDRLSTNDGVLILTDSFGSTPCNIANEFLDNTGRALVSGLNLPMLIRIMNYRSLPLAELKEKAIALAGELAAQSALAVRGVMEVAVGSEDRTLDELLRAERAAFACRIRSSWSSSIARMLFIGFWLPISVRWSPASAGRSCG